MPPKYMAGFGALAFFAPGVQDLMMNLSQHGDSGELEAKQLQDNTPALDSALLGCSGCSYSHYQDAYDFDNSCSGCSADTSSDSGGDGGADGGCSGCGRSGD
jgi:hypothetical protein